MNKLALVALLLLCPALSRAHKLQFFDTFISSTPTVTLSAAAGLACADTNVVFTGAVVNLGCFLGPSASLLSATGYHYTCGVSASNQVTIRACCNNGVNLVTGAVACGSVPSSQVVKIVLRRA